MSSRRRLFVWNYYPIFKRLSHLVPLYDGQSFSLPSRPGHSNLNRYKHKHNPLLLSTSLQIWLLLPALATTSIQPHWSTSLQPGSKIWWKVLKISAAISWFMKWDLQRHMDVTFGCPHTFGHSCYFFSLHIICKARHMTSSEEPAHCNVPRISSLFSPERERARERVTSW